MSQFALNLRRSAMICAASAFLPATVHAQDLPTPSARKTPAKPPTAVSALQRATIPALRAPAAKSVPTGVKRFATMSAKFSPLGLVPSAKLTRVVTFPKQPGTVGSSTWYVMPARGGVCMYDGSHAGSCLPDDLVRHGRLYLQSIAPLGTNPIPPAGQAVPSTIVGVLPDGFTSVTATQQGGQQVSAVLLKGMYLINATDIVTNVSFGSTLVMPRLPGH